MRIRLLIFLSVNSLHIRLDNCMVDVQGVPKQLETYIMYSLQSSTNLYNTVA